MSSVGSRTYSTPSAQNFSTLTIGGLAVLDWAVFTGHSSGSTISYIEKASTSVITLPPPYEGSASGASYSNGGGTAGTTISWTSDGTPTATGSASGGARLNNFNAGDDWGAAFYLAPGETGTFNVRLLWGHSDTLLATSSHDFDYYIVDSSDTLVGSITTDSRALVSGDTDFQVDVQFTLTDATHKIKIHPRNVNRDGSGNIRTTVKGIWISVKESAGPTTHTTTGVLTGQGANLSGTASSETTRLSSGILTGQASSLSGVSARTRAHDNIGVLLGGGASVTGDSSTATTRTSVGVLLGQGAVLSGVASSATIRGATGVLTGQGAVLSSEAAIGAGKSTTGTLQGQGSVVVGVATKKTVHQTSGDLLAEGANVLGTAQRVAALVNHETDGVLNGAGTKITGLASGSVIIKKVVGGGIDHQRKRKKSTLADRPNEQLDSIIAKAFKTVFSELTDKKAPRSVKKQANKIVSEYAGTYRPTVDEVNWAEFNQDVEAVQRLFALYQREIAEKRLFEQIENDNIEFLLMH